MMEITFEEQYNLLTGKIFMQATRFLNQQFKNAGLNITREQWTVLAVLWHQDGIAQQKIADETDRDKPSTTRLLDNLEKMGYIERKADTADRRINSIFLTPLGRDSEQKIMEVVNDTFDKITSGIKESALKTVRTVFSQVYQNISNQA
jgi:DNA-binding MarR family transcriptional regulator